jgi:hypothetical protein
VSAVEVDEFWPQASLADARHEVEEYLEARDGGEIRLRLVGPQDEVLSTRRQRRVIQRRRLRGIRPADEVECKTTPWYRRPKKASAKHPRYKRTQLVLAHEPDGSLVVDVRRECPKPAPNRRRAATPVIDTDMQIDEPVESATTEITESGDLLESDVVLEQTNGHNSPTAIIVVPQERESRVEPDGDPDPEILSMIFDGEVPENWDCCALPECIHTTRYKPQIASLHA